MAPKALPAAELHQALAQVLSESQYREAAARIQQILRATGEYLPAADEIQAFIAAGKAKVTS